MYLSLTPKGRSNVLVAYNRTNTMLALYGLQRLLELIIFTFLISQLQIFEFPPVLLGFLLFFADVYTVLVKVFLALLIKGDDSFAEQDCSHWAHYLSVDEKLGWFTSDTLWHIPVLWVWQSVYTMVPLWVSCALVYGMHSPFWAIFIARRAFYSTAVVAKVLVILTLQRLDCDQGVSYKFTRSFTFGWKKDNLPTAEEIGPQEDLPLGHPVIQLRPGTEIIEIREV